MDAKRQFLQGTLEILILKVLTWGPLHGYGIASWLEQRTDEVLAIEEGSLYPALYRMERRGWIEAEWRITEKNRRAKYYRITRSGRAQLKRESAAWSEFAGAVAAVLKGEERPSWSKAR